MNVNSRYKSIKITLQNTENKGNKKRKTKIDDQNQNENRNSKITIIKGKPKSNKLINVRNNQPKTEHKYDDN